MVELATGYVSLAISTKGMGRDIGRQFAGVQAQADQTGKKSGKKFAGGFGLALKAGLVGAGIAAGVAAAKGLGSVLTAASGAQQAIGGVGAVFGGNAKEIEGASKRAATAAGLSTTAYQELATTLGAGLKNQGVKGFTGATESLIATGADLAAQFGGSSKEAVEALASAMRGESDPIERYGVSLNESAVNAELARKGQSKLTGQALITAKAEARLALITKQTADATGAFAREQDTLAGKQQIASAQWENLKTKIGGSFLPIATKAMGFVSDKMIPAFSRLSSFLAEKIGPAFARLKAFLGGVSTSGAPATSFLQTKLIPAFQGIGGAVQRMAAVVMPIIRSIVGAFIREWPKIKPIVMGIFSTIGGIVTDVMALIKGRIQQATAVISFIWKRWGPQISKVVVETFRVVAKVIGGVMKVVGGIIKVVTALMVGDWRKAGKGIKMIVSGLKDVLVGLFGRLASNIKATIAGLIKSAIAKFLSLLDWVRTKFKAGMAKVRDFILDPIRAARDKLSQILGAGGPVRQVFKNAVDAIGTIWDKLKAKAKAPIKFIVNTVLKGGLVKAFDAIAGKVGAGTIGDKIKWPSFAVGGWTGPGARMKPAGLVHADEHVWTKEEMRRFPGGHKAMERLREKVRKGALHGPTAELPGFAGGGPVGKIKDAAKAGAGFVWKTITKIVKMGGALKAALNKALGNMAGAGSSAFGDIGKAVARKASGAMYEKGKDWVQKIVTKVKERISTPGGGTGGLPGQGGGQAAARRAGYRIMGTYGTTYPGHLPTMARAKDFAGSAAQQIRLRQHLVANRKAYNIMYVISRMRIWSARNWGGRPYTPISRSGDYRHMAHVHASFYDKGGKLQPGLNMTYNGTRKPEAVLTTPQWDTAKKAIDNHTPGAGLTINGGVHGLDAEQVAKEIEKKQRRLEALQPSYA